MGCRYFLNSKCAWYADTFEGTFEISMTCLVVFSILVSMHEPIRQRSLDMTHYLSMGAQNCKPSRHNVRHFKAFSCRFEYIDDGLAWNWSASPQNNQLL